MLSPVGAARRGLTLPELMIALAVLGLLAAFALRAGVPLVDAARTRAAAGEVRSAFATARGLATLRAERAAVRIDTTHAAITVHLGPDSAVRRPLGALYGVRLTATRDSMAYAASGLGWGAANLRVEVRRGAAVETVTVSRLGRVR
ncbi:MAG: prepilin-type N-terminal cleavage/methylation domain-containing protein [Gemmatirosa sp.]